MEKELKWEYHVDKMSSFSGKTKEEIDDIVYYGRELEFYCGEEADCITGLNVYEIMLMRSLCRYGKFQYNGRVYEEFDNEIVVPHSLSLFSKYHDVKYLGSPGEIRVSRIDWEVVKYLEQSFAWVTYCPVIQLGNHKFIMLGRKGKGWHIFPCNKYHYLGCYRVGDRIYYPDSLDSEFVIKTSKNLEVFSLNESGIYECYSNFRNKEELRRVEGSRRRQACQKEKEAWREFVFEPLFKKVYEDKDIVTPSVSKEMGQQFAFIWKHPQLKEKFCDALKYISPRIGLEVISIIEKVLISAHLVYDRDIFVEITNVYPHNLPARLDLDKCRNESVNKCFENDDSLSPLVVVGDQYDIPFIHSDQVDVFSYCIPDDNIRNAGGVVLNNKLSTLQYQAQVIEWCYDALRPAGVCIVVERLPHDRNDAVVYEVLDLVAHAIYGGYYVGFRRVPSRRFRTLGGWEKKFQIRGFDLLQATTNPFTSECTMVFQKEYDIKEGEAAPVDYSSRVTKSVKMKRPMYVTAVDNNEPMKMFEKLVKGSDLTVADMIEKLRFRRDGPIECNILEDI